MRTQHTEQQVVVEKGMTRISVGFPPNIYRDVERIAKDKKVSVAWVVRDAVERYVADQWPLLEQRSEGRQ